MCTDVPLLGIPHTTNNTFKVAAMTTSLISMVVDILSVFVFWKVQFFSIFTKKSMIGVSEFRRVSKGVVSADRDLADILDMMKRWLFLLQFPVPSFRRCIGFFFLSSLLLLWESLLPTKYISTYLSSKTWQTDSFM